MSGLATLKAHHRSHHQCSVGITVDAPLLPDICDALRSVTRASVGQDRTLSSLGQLHACMCAPAATVYALVMPSPVAQRMLCCHHAVPRVACTLCMLSMEGGKYQHLATGKMHSVCTTEPQWCDADREQGVPQLHLAVCRPLHLELAPAHQPSAGRQCSSNPTTCCCRRCRRNCQPRQKVQQQQQEEVQQEEEAAG